MDINKDYTDVKVFPNSKKSVRTIKNRAKVSIIETEKDEYGKDWALINAPNSNNLQEMYVAREEIQCYEVSNIPAE